MKHLIALLAGIGMCLATCSGTFAAFSLVENFESLTLGPLDGQGGWIVQSQTAADYSENGRVDAADYIVWRENLNASFALPNENGDCTTCGVVDQEDYDFWLAKFGKTDHMVAVDPSNPSNQAVAVTRGNGGIDPQAFKPLGGSIPDGSIGTVFSAFETSPTTDWSRHLRRVTW